MDFTFDYWIEIGMLLFIGDVVVAGGWIVALGVSYVSICLGDIGYVATCVYLWLLVLEMLLSLLEAVG